MNDTTHGFSGNVNDTIIQTDNDLWNVTKDHDGKIVESFDPTDASVRLMLEKELQIDHEAMSRQTTQFEQVVESDSASLSVHERTVVLLTLLRDRIKAEAGVPRNHLCVFIHYQPLFSFSCIYLFHVHFTRWENEIEIGLVL